MQVSFAVTIPFPVVLLIIVVLFRVCLDVLTKIYDKAFAFIFKFYSEIKSVLYILINPRNSVALYLIFHRALNFLFVLPHNSRAVQQRWSFRVFVYSWMQFFPFEGWVGWVVCFRLYPSSVFTVFSILRLHYNASLRSIRH